MAFDITEDQYAELLGKTPKRGDMRKMYHKVFKMFVAFIGETMDFGDAIKEEFPTEWAFVNMMEMQKK